MFSNYFLNPIRRSEICQFRTILLFHYFAVAVKVGNEQKYRKSNHQESTLVIAAIWSARYD